MAVNPNSTCASFCSWIQVASWLHPTSAQLALISEIETAANNNQSVSDHTWNEFLRVTGLWYQYYVAFLAQTQQSDTDSSDSEVIFDFVNVNGQFVCYSAFDDIMDLVQITCYSQLSVLTKIQSII